MLLRLQQACVAPGRALSRVWSRGVSTPFVYRRQCATKYNNSIEIYSLRLPHGHLDAQPAIFTRTLT